MSKIIAIANHKGGVGKTTSVVNIGARLANMGKRVLLIDLDPQASLSQSLGVIDPETTIYDSIRGEHPLQPLTIYENLDLIPSELDLIGAEIELSSEMGREYILKELIQEIKTDYDYIFIDCPPSLGLLTVNALTASEEVYIPLQAQFLAMRGLTKLSEVIAKIQKSLNKKLVIGGVFITQYDKRKILNRDVVNTINKHFNNNVLKTSIRDNVALAEAPVQGLDIFRYNPKCYGAEDYRALCKEILKI